VLGISVEIVQMEGEGEWSFATSAIIPEGRFMLRGMLLRVLGRSWRQFIVRVRLLMRMRGRKGIVMGRVRNSFLYYRENIDNIISCKRGLGL
jgi:hypothetical protein